MYIRRIDQFSCAKVLGAIHGLLGFAMALFFAAGAQTLDVITRSVMWTPDEYADPGSVPDFSSWGLAAVLWIPLVYAVLGFAVGWVGAWIYNMVAARTGGIRLEVDMEGGG